MTKAPIAPLDTTKLAAARLWAVTKFPYLANAIFACPPVAAAGAGTVTVDRGWRLHADPDEVARFTVDELGRLLVHLVSHLVRDHADRADAARVTDDTRARWGRGADAEINDDLAAVDCLPPVSNDLPRDLGAAAGLLAEQYFEIQHDEPTVSASSGPGSGCGSGADGRTRPTDGAADDEDGLTRGQSELLRHSTATQIQQAHQRDPGSVPGGWVRWAEAVLPSTTDWRRALRSEIRRAVVSRSGSVDYTYRRPARRHSTPAPSGARVVMPSLHRPLPSVAIVCDTSGSMDEGLLADALAEVDAILARCGLRSARVPVLAVDTAVQAVRRVSRASQALLAGGGGTDMGAGIVAAGELRPRPDVVVVLTDGYTPWPERPPHGARVVIGLLGDGGEPPEWARSVRISR